MPKSEDKLSITGNILSKTSILLTLFSVVVVVFTVILAFFGIKWITEITKLHKEVEGIKKIKLDAARLTYASLPELNQHQVIPERYSALLSQLHDLVNNPDYKEIIDKNPDCEELRFLDALYFLSRSDYNPAKRLLENMEKKYTLDPDLRGEINFRLGIAYRQEGKFKDSYDKFSELKGNRKIYSSFSQAVTMFAHLQYKDNIDPWNEYSKEKEEFYQFITNELIESADTNQENISMQFLAAEFKGYILAEEDDMINALIETKNDKEKKKVWAEEMNIYIRNSINISNSQLYAQTDKKIIAGWHSALAYIYYYSLSSQRMMT